MMAKLAGRHFADPRCADAHVEEEPHALDSIPAGFKLSRILFAMQENGSISGWQLYWTADGVKDMESPRRGNWALMGITTQVCRCRCRCVTCLSFTSSFLQELKVPKDDFAVDLEYLYDGVATVGVRMRMHFSGWTRWIGGKTSMSTLSVLLCSAMGPKQDFEDFRDKCIGKRERSEPAMPLEMVIGLSGVVTSGPIAQQRATKIGLIVRKVQQHHLFSYNWVQDMLKGQQPAPEAADPPHNAVAATTGPVPAKAVPADKAEGGSLSSRNTHSVVRRKNLDADSVASQSLESLEESGEPPPVVSAHGTHLAPALKSASAQRNRPQSETAEKEERTQPLSPPEAMLASEVQFFDVLRMRSMEIDAAFKRAEEFARKVLCTVSRLLCSRSLTPSLLFLSLLFLSRSLPAVDDQSVCGASNSLEASECAHHLRPHHVAVQRHQSVLDWTLRDRVAGSDLAQEVQAAAAAVARAAQASRRQSRGGLGAGDGATPLDGQVHAFSLRAGAAEGHADESEGAVRRGASSVHRVY
jgi:hypothetical protein